MPLFATMVCEYDPTTDELIVLAINPGRETDEEPNYNRPVFDERRGALVYDVEGVVVSRKPMFGEV